MTDAYGTWENKCPCRINAASADGHYNGKHANPELEILKENDSNVAMPVTCSDGILTPIAVKLISRRIEAILKSFGSAETNEGNSMRHYILPAKCGTQINTYSQITELREI